jgi:hypothetical protein
VTDWKDVFKDAVAAGTAKLEARGSEAASYLEDIVKAQKASLESLLKAFLDGRIDKETMEGELANEKRVLRAELLAVQAIGKKGAQDAANAFFDVIESALAAGIRGLI